MTQYPLVTIVGGSGFLGRHLIKQLARGGWRIRVLCRDTVAAEFLKTAGTVGQIVPQYADITRPETLTGKFAGSHAVINLVSILYERGSQQFEAINVDGAQRVAEQARAAGAERLIHVSALGIDQAIDTKYGSSKKAGELAVRTAFPGATIIRPSLLVGPEDQFFQRFARMSLLSPVLPLVGGAILLQPTLVTDVASAIAAVLGDSQTVGKTYELGGPQVLNFRQWLEYMRSVINRRALLIPLPYRLARFIGRVCQILPFPPVITADQVKLLRHNNVVSPHALGYRTLHIAPAVVSEALPELLARYVKE